MTDDQLASILKEDDEVKEAMKQPKSPRIALLVFNAIRENENLCTTAGGMEHIVTGLKKGEICDEAKRFYNIDLTRFKRELDYYEHKMLKSQSEKRADK